MAMHSQLDMSNRSVQHGVMRGSMAREEGHYASMAHCKQHNTNASSRATGHLGTMVLGQPSSRLAAPFMGLQRARPGAG